MTNYDVKRIAKSVVESRSNYGKAIDKIANRPSYMSTFSANEIEISGSTLTGLVNYGVLKVIGNKDVFICVDEYEETYKKVKAKIYAVNCDIFELNSAFNDIIKEYKVSKIEKKIASLKAQLKNALFDLDNIKWI